MGINKQISLYWGNSTLYFTEITSAKISKFFSIPLENYKSTVETNKSSSHPTDDNRFISSSMKLVSSIEAQFKANKISDKTVNLSLPTKDIIFRSFVIPWMNASEIKSVVSFEISKYIPFSLEELRYSFHPITITANNSKKIRIIFVGVRKDTLENYTNILESAGLNVDNIEPSSQSIVRVLLSQNLIQEKQTIAIVEKEELSGKITIVEQEIPQFVREFHLNIQTKDTTAHENTDIINRLINEIRISIDYFTRQENFNPVLEIKLIANTSNNNNFSEHLSRDLKIPTTVLGIENIIQNKEINNIGYLNAYGIGLYSTTAMASSFNFSKKEIKKARTISAPNPTSSHNGTVTILLTCAVLVGLIFFGTTKMTEKSRNDLTRLEQELGMHKDAMIETITETTTKTTESLTHLKTIRTKSNIAFFLATIPTLLPQGLWIKNFEVNYTDAYQNKDDYSDENKTKNVTKDNSTPIVSISGYAYSQNITEQFKLVNKFFNNIEDHPKLSTIFKQIDLEIVRAEKIENLTVTYYKIQCQ